MLRLYTDGSYCETSGVGSWAWILVDGDERQRGSGIVEGETTPQRMELTAAVEGLSRLPRGTSVEVVSDSTYLVEPLSRGFLRTWRANGWRSLHHDRLVANRDLWERLIELSGRLRVRFRWVRAHDGDQGDPWNVRADHLARDARRAGEAAA